MTSSTTTTRQAVQREAAEEADRERRDLERRISDARDAVYARRLPDFRPDAPAPDTFEDLRDEVLRLRAHVGAMHLLLSTVSAASMLAQAAALPPED